VTIFQFKIINSRFKFICGQFKKLPLGCLSGLVNSAGDTIRGLTTPAWPGIRTGASISLNNLYLVGDTLQNFCGN
jgi:hypothetical protein